MLSFFRPGAVKRRVRPSSSWGMPSDSGRITARSTGPDTRTSTGNAILVLRTTTA